jgi:hypothetical protein
MIIYINGFKASKFDLEMLCRDLKNGTQTATFHRTKKGNIAITTA